MITFSTLGGRFGELFYHIFRILRFCIINNVIDKFVLDYDYKSIKQFKNTSEEFVIQKNLDFFKKLSPYFKTNLDISNFHIIKLIIDTGYTFSIDFFYNFFKFTIFKKSDNIIFTNFHNPINRIRDELDKKILFDYFYDHNLWETIRCKYPFINNNSLAVHVRRTDFLYWENGSNILQKNNIINTIENKLNISNYDNIVIFSDDIEWCMKNLNVYSNIIYMPSNLKPYEYIILMSMCKDIIPTNRSNFSSMAFFLKSFNTYL